jgi:hypothetical protein
VGCIITRSKTKRWSTELHLCNRLFVSSEVLSIELSKYNFTKKPKKGGDEKFINICNTGSGNGFIPAVPCFNIYIYIYIYIK